jgi:hypothetical protein
VCPPRSIPASDIADGPRGSIHEQGFPSWKVSNFEDLKKAIGYLFEHNEEIVHFEMSKVLRRLPLHRHIMKYRVRLDMVRKLVSVHGERKRTSRRAEWNRRKRKKAAKAAAVPCGVVTRQMERTRKEREEKEKGEKKEKKEQWIAGHRERKKKRKRERKKAERERKKAKAGNPLGLTEATKVRLIVGDKGGGKTFKEFLCLLARKYPKVLDVVLYNEDRTSQRCCCCGRVLHGAKFSTWEERQRGAGKKVTSRYPLHTVRVCKKDCPHRVWNRDVNAAINLVECYVQEKRTGRRPWIYTKSKPSRRGAHSPMIPDDASSDRRNCS